MRESPPEICKAVHLDVRDTYGRGKGAVEPVVPTSTLDILTTKRRSAILLVSKMKA